MSNTELNVRLNEILDMVLMSLKDDQKPLSRPVVLQLMREAYDLSNED